MSEDLPRAYEGDRDYVFVGYSHADRDAVLPIIRALVDEGFRVWYDEGIELAEDYPEYVADHVFRCTCFVMFVSRSSLASTWCRQEIDYALDLGRTILPIYLEDVELTRGLKMRMGNKQALFWYEYESDEAFNRKLFKARRLESCLSDEGRRRGGVKRRPRQDKGGGPAANGTEAADKGGVVPVGSAQSARKTPPVVKPTSEREVATQTVGEPPDLIADTRSGAQASGGQRPSSSGQADEGARTRFLERIANEAADKPRHAVPSVEPKGSLNDYTWAELKEISRAIAAAGSDAEWKAIAREYRLVDSDDRLHGAEKGFKMIDGTDASVRILGFRHDDLAGDKGKAGISFEFAGVPMAHRMNPRGTNEGGWRDSEMRLWLNSEFFSLLPEDLRANVAEARKMTNNKGEVSESDANVVGDTPDRLWLLSMAEVYGKPSGQVEWHPRFLAVFDAEGTQYQLYKDKEVTLSNYGPCQKRGADSWWWLRSPDASGSRAFLDVYSDGGWRDWDLALNDGGVSPGFCF